MHLARLAWQTGIRRWLAYSLEDNLAVLKVLTRAGDPISRRSLSGRLVETTCALGPYTA